MYDTYRPVFENVQLAQFRWLVECVDGCKNKMKNYRFEKNL